MFLLVQMYSVLDHVHVRIHAVAEDPMGAPGATIIRLNEEAHLPPEIKTERDWIAWLGEELVDIAHSSNPLL